MSFWAGVFAGLTVWFGFILVLELLLFERSDEIGRSETIIRAVLTVVCALATWYIVTFGGQA